MINESNKFFMISLIYFEVEMGSGGGSERWILGVKFKDCK